MSIDRRTNKSATKFAISKQKYVCVCAIKLVIVKLDASEGGHQSLAHSVHFSKNFQENFSGDSQGPKRLENNCTGPHRNRL